MKKIDTGVLLIAIYWLFDALRSLIVRHDRLPNLHGFSQVWLDFSELGTYLTHFSIDIFIAISLLKMSAVGRDLAILFFILNLGSEPVILIPIRLAGLIYLILPKVKAQFK